MEENGKWHVSSLTWQDEIARTRTRLTDSLSTDHEIFVNETPFYVEKKRLMLWSSYFTTLFTSDFMENSGRIDIVWTSTESFENLLVFIYIQCDLQNYRLTDKELLELAEAANYFCVLPVLLKCKMEIGRTLLSDYKKDDIEFTLSALELSFKIEWTEIRDVLKWKLMNDPLGSVSDERLLSLFRPCKKFFTHCMFDLVSNGRPEVRDEELQKRNLRTVEQALEKEWAQLRNEFDEKLEREDATISLEILSFVTTVQNVKPPIIWEDFQGCLNTISPQQVEVTKHNYVNLIYFANDHRIVPLMLKCLDFIYDNYVEMREEHLYVFVKLATVIEHTHFREQIKDFIRSKKTPSNELQWFQDNKNEIQQLDPTCQAFIFNCLISTD